MQNVGVDLSEQLSREIALTSIGQDGDDGLAWSKMFCESLRDRDIRTRRDAAENALFSREVSTCLNRFLVADRADVVIDIGIEYGRDDAIAYALLLVRSYRTSREDGGVLRFSDPDGDIGECFFEDLADPGDGASCAESSTEAIDRRVDVAQDLLSGGGLVRLEIVGVLKLLRDVYAWIVRGHFSSYRDAAIDTLADVAFIMNEYHFSSVLRYKGMSLARDGIRHDQDRFIAFYCADERKADALVAAGRFDDDGIFTKEPTLFGTCDHLHCCAGLDRPTNIESLVFDDDPCHIGRGHMVKSDERRIADRVEYRAVDHSTSLHSLVSIARLLIIADLSCVPWCALRRAAFQEGIGAFLRQSVCMKGAVLYEALGDNGMYAESV